MKRLATTVVSLSLIASLPAHANETSAMLNASTFDDVRNVAPGLEKYAQGPLADLCKPPGLAPHKTHLETPHFKKYKADTQEMVKSLKLVDTVPIMLGAKPK